MDRVKQDSPFLVNGKKLKDVEFILKLKFVLKTYKWYSNLLKLICLVF